MSTATMSQKNTFHAITFTICIVGIILVPTVAYLANTVVLTVPTMSTFLITFIGACLGVALGYVILEVKADLDGRHRVEELSFENRMRTLSWSWRTEQAEKHAQAELDTMVAESNTYFLCS